MNKSIITLINRLHKSVIDSTTLTGLYKIIFNVCASCQLKISLSLRISKYQNHAHGGVCLLINSIAKHTNALGGI